MELHHEYNDYLEDENKLESMLNYLFDIPSKRFLTIVLMGALVTRALVSILNYTPMQEDDYTNVIAPALKALQIGAPIETVEYRLSIFPKLFYFAILPFHRIGIDSPATLVSIGYIFQALISLFGIWGMFRLGSLFLEDGANRQMVLLYAFFFLMPLVSTRSFLESYSLNTVPWAFYYTIRGLSQNKHSRDLFWGALLLGITVIIRFQTGILALIALLFVLYRYRLSKPSFLFAAGGILSLGILGFLDWLDGRPPLSTILAYISLNFQGNIASASYGKAPWYSYILMFPLLLIPPASFVFFAGFLKTIKSRDTKIWILLSGFTVFVLFHTLIPNKLERFIIPVIPLYVVLAYKGFTEFSSHLRTLTVRIFWAVNIPLLLLVFGAKSQSNIIDAAVYLKDKKGAVVLYNVDLWKQAYAGFNKSEPPVFREPNSLISYIRTTRTQSFYLLHFLQMEKLLAEKLGAARMECRVEKTFSPGFLEWLVIQANPEKNRRRSATWLYLCKQKPTLNH